LLVTHDVDEAIFLADRVVAMRSGRLAAEHPVVFEGERSRRNPEFEELRHRLLAELGVAELAETR
ncbi:MAG TPA: sulfonate ABC transporter ATP-binding protein, partial [Streptomyces sp.]